MNFGQRGHPVLATVFLDFDIQLRECIASLKLHISKDAKQDTSHLLNCFQSISAEFKKCATILITDQGPQYSGYALPTYVIYALLNC